MKGVDKYSPVEEKIKLFKNLFQGRQDVFARRFESTKTGKSGYQPVCENEWKVGVCEKPKVNAHFARIANLCHMEIPSLKNICVGLSNLAVFHDRLSPGFTHY